MEILTAIWYNYLVRIFFLRKLILKRRISMSNGKVMIAAAAVTICAIGLTTATIVVCKKLFEKKYFTVSDGIN